MLNFFSKIFSDDLKKYERIFLKISEKGKKFGKIPLEKFPDIAKDTRLKIQKANRVSPEDMATIFALAREASFRTIHQKPFKEQVIAGLVLFDGKIAEMKTGEGKTLAATMPLTLAAISGKASHLVTVNDYLARRDAVWMGPIYRTLGLSVGVIQSSLSEHGGSYQYRPASSNQKIQADLTGEEIDPTTHHLVPCSRKEAYQCDIVYGTNNEFGFDYLRNNMVYDKIQETQGKLEFAIIDEVDSVLIDEARTPLIISSPDQESTKKYIQFSRLIRDLSEDHDYNIDEKARTCVLTEKGISHVEKMLQTDNIYGENGIETVHHIEQALRARTLFKKDRDYIVKDDEVIIVDEFTGRLMPGRRFSEGLHQALEAKENVTIQKESKTLAAVSFQNFFRLYEKLAGMTGTAATEAEEFSKIYKLDVVVIPTHKKMIRTDENDIIYKTLSGKYRAIVDEVEKSYRKGQPVLVGTVSVEKSEKLSQMLTKKNIPHEVLNAKFHEMEAKIVARAGEKKSVTIATNMAGRGTDIKLGKGVIDLGGLSIIGSERHESRRIDNQLRGRSGRQGDPGKSRFFISLEDDLMRIFGGEKLQNIMNTLGLPEDQPIESRVVSRTIESAQKRVEGHNFDIRKHLVDYDDVINKQRESVYRMRQDIVHASFVDKENIEYYQKEYSLNGIESIVFDYLNEVIDDFVEMHTLGVKEEWNLKEIAEIANSISHLDFSDSYFPSVIKDEVELHEARKKIKKLLFTSFFLEFEKRRDEYGKKALLKTYQILLLQIIDRLWMSHLDLLDYVRRGIGLRGYGHQDPLVEYKKEAYNHFQKLLSEVRDDFVNAFLKIRIIDKGTMKRKEISEKHDRGSFIKHGFQNGEISLKKVGRNDPCPCGAKRKDGRPAKYKHCHGR